LTVLCERDIERRQKQRHLDGNRTAGAKVDTKAKHFDIPDAGSNGRL
jgi:hypothetical protein